MELVIKFQWLVEKRGVYLANYEARLPKKNFLKYLKVSLQLQYDFDYKTAVNNVLSKHSTKLFARNPVVCFLEVDKTCVDAFGILPKFLEILLER